MTMNDIARATLTEKVFAVESSVIEDLTMVWHAGSSAEIETVVTFKSGKQYGYIVPIKVVAEWLNADSVGRFYNKNIRGHYEGERL